VRMDREMKNVDDRIKGLMKKLNQTLDIHQGSFSKHLEKIENMDTAISDTSFNKLESEAQSLVKTYNYASFYEQQRLTSFRALENILKKHEVITQEEPQMMRLEHEDKEQEMERVQQEIDFQLYN